LNRRYITLAYQDGLIEGGIFDAELSERDYDNIAKMVAGSSQYVTDLGNAIFKEDAVTDAMAAQKPELWFNKTVMPAYDMALLESDANGNYIFTGDDGDESCHTCSTLKGQVHRLSAWARKGLRPGTDGDNFECGLWKCQHFLRKVFAQARGNWI
jgi:hypothetical protein